MPAIASPAAPFPSPGTSSMPRRPTGPTTATRRLVFDRARYRCEVCYLLLHDGQRWTQPYSVHHRRPRGMGGTTDPAANSPANLLLVCGTGTTGCHGDIEAHRTRAIIRGHLVPQHQDPATVPVRLHHDRTVLLDHDGGAVAVALRDPALDPWAE